MDKIYFLKSPKYGDMKCTVTILGRSGNKIIWDAMPELAKGRVQDQFTACCSNKDYQEYIFTQLDRKVIGDILDWVVNPEFSEIPGNMVEKRWSYETKINGRDYTKYMVGRFDNGVFMGLSEYETEHIDIISQ